MVRSAFENRSVQAMLPTLPGFARRPAPLSAAVDAIETGIRRRKARVWAPRYVGPALLARGVLQPLTELRVMRSRKLKAVLADADPAVARSSADAGEREPAVR
jgi:hypothetical protein